VVLWVFGPSLQRDDTVTAGEGLDVQRQPYGSSTGICLKECNQPCCHFSLASTASPICDIREPRFGHPCYIARIGWITCEYCTGINVEGKRRGLISGACPEVRPHILRSHNHVNLMDELAVESFMAT